MKTILVYHDGGETCLHEQTESRKKLMLSAKQSGHIGYLYGYRYWDGATESVIVFFKEKPTQIEIERRRANGLRAAKWYYIHV